MRELEAGDVGIPEFDAESDPEEWGVILEGVREELAANPGRWTQIAGNVSGVCPECGTPIEQNVSERT